MLTPFCYTQGSTQVSGRFCLPDEPIDKQIVDTELSKPQNLIKRIAGDLGGVRKNEIFFEYLFSFV